LKDPVVYVIFIQEHVGARIAVKAQVFAAVIPHRDKYGGGAGKGVDKQTPRIDASIAQAFTQVLAERIIAYFTDETRIQPEALDCYCHIGWRATGGFDKTGRVSQRNVGAGRYKLDQQFTHAYDVCHST
jgi:hypothetical protein